MKTNTLFKNKTIKFLLLCIIFKNVKSDVNSYGYCDISKEICQDDKTNDKHEKFLFYDVNPPEGFNLRRDVYMRFAIMLSEAQKHGKKLNWKLVLPPWFNLYHWKSKKQAQTPLPWSQFFDITSLQAYAPVIEIDEVFRMYSKNFLNIDSLYILQNYDDPFENGVFDDKWEISEDCHYNGQYWGYNNITVNEVICVKFQGKISMLWEIASMHSANNKIMFAHGEIPLHDTYGTKPYWDCRKSMKFSQKLIDAASKFISKNFNCNSSRCDNYISIHWRRQDFARYRTNDVPSTEGTSKQIHKTIIDKSLKTEKIFIASDATVTEKNNLEKQLNILGYKVYFYKPNKKELDEYKDGGVAIIEQIICSRGSYFIGTHESTFSFRIQEEREILRFDSSTTFNRLCPDKGPCERPSKWTIVS